ncbi:hypothetical protein LCGC14_1086000 [marine sediment metagenome]|uniref:Uncharacterized protein n=1 Tax=marine sediment metagenome TaxID=412755 RepID=A0A0F9MDY1_9ZZZZ
MATTAITPTPLVRDVMSADILDAAGTVATTPTDGWVIAAPVAPDVDLLLKFLVDASGDTITIVAGDRPPSHLSGLGNLLLVLAASDVRYIMIEKGRFLQDDGTFLVTATDAGSTCYAFTIPKIL